MCKMQTSYEAEDMAFSNVKYRFYNFNGIWIYIYIWIPVPCIHKVFIIKIKIACLRILFREWGFQMVILSTFSYVIICLWQEHATWIFKIKIACLKIRSMKLSDGNFFNFFICLVCLWKNMLHWIVLFKIILFLMNKSKNEKYKQTSTAFWHELGFFWWHNDR